MLPETKWLGKKQGGIMEPTQNYQVNSQPERPDLGTRSRQAVGNQLFVGECQAMGRI